MTVHSVQEPDHGAAERRRHGRRDADGTVHRALQLTNILKDVREDLDRGICWLPKDRLAAHGLSVRTLALPEKRQQAVALLDELVGVARQEIDRAFEYTLALPESETGLRLFCLWPLFFAVLTLQML